MDTFRMFFFVEQRKKTVQIEHSSQEETSSKNSTCEIERCESAQTSTGTTQ